MGIYIINHYFGSDSITLHVHRGCTPFLKIASLCLTKCELVWQRAKVIHNSMCDPVKAVLTPTQLLRARAVEEVIVHPSAIPTKRREPECSSLVPLAVCDLSDGSWLIGIQSCSYRHAVRVRTADTPIQRIPFMCFSC